jgi:transposase InsO family protein
VSDKYEFIDGLKYAYPVARMCAWLSVSRSGFYEWRSRPLSATAERRESIKEAIREIFDGSDQTYGYRRVHAALARQGRPASPELVRALMRGLGLRPCQPRPWRLTTVADPAAATPDLVGRDFTADRPGARMVGDITYIKTWAGWLYLATVIDCYTKMVIGYAMADHMRASLVIAAIEMAARRCELPAGAVFHSDRGCQYSSAEFRSCLKRCGITASVGRTGVCWDNAMAESFNGTLKNELVYRTVYPTREHARADIASYIEIFYNRRRLHSGLGYRTPHEVYDEYQNRQVVA